MGYFGSPPLTPVIRPADGYASSMSSYPLPEAYARSRRGTVSHSNSQFETYGECVSDSRSRRSSRDRATDGVFGDVGSSRHARLSQGHRRGSSVAPPPSKYAPIERTRAPSSTQDYDSARGPWPHFPDDLSPSVAGLGMPRRSDFGLAARSSASSSRRSRSTRSEDPRAARREQERRTYELGTLPSASARFAAPPALLHSMADPYTPRTPPSTHLSGSSGSSRSRRSDWDMPSRTESTRDPLMRSQGRLYPQYGDRMAPSEATLSDHSQAPRLRRMVGRTSLSSSYNHSGGKGNGDYVAWDGVQLLRGARVGVSIAEISVGKKSKRRNSGFMWWK
ncbi:hypothetical protein LTR85_009433 [Meristemomyces frigidus]|nr:hypothetical protein LTR85_009433 [Meristemomyces frigidus]